MISGSRFPGPGRPRRRPTPSPLAPEHRPRRRRWPALVGLLVVLALLAVEAGRAVIPPRALRSGPRTVEIPPQQGLLDVARTLVDAGVIRSRLAFVALAVLRGTARSLKAGEYEVPQGASLLTTLQLIEAGKVKPHLIVLPEGFTVRELARQLESEGIARAAEVLRVASDGFFAQSLGIEAPSLEGYLFPDTYQVTKGTRVEEVLGRMVHRFREKIAAPDVLARASARGLSLHELVTLASIIEKEAVVPEERPLIAGVFWNRLRRDMLLQADPTVAYAAGKEGRAPTREDLQIDHPFNTYRYRGLPPGPIASPGRASVDASLAPADVPYLYFVSIDDRRHHFSATLAEHNEAVTRYRASRGRTGAL
ncbi:MAG TPA: endolytic transglycosylase MltG [Methylomirabilota bacterium]|nr:endolytic transglycosylase MltG [Methylomirabilota bacterium]